MSEINPDFQSTASPRGIATKSPRPLACAACQQRKVKCDRKFPCNTCVKSRTQCIPVTVPRQRRRRFPEAELLQRVRHLEDLLRQHNIDFEPLHRDATDKTAEKNTEQKEGSPEIKTETTFEAKNLWQAMSQTVRPHRNLSLMEEVLIAGHQSPDANDDEEDDNDDPDVEDLRDVAGKKSWDQLFKNSADFLLFGSLIENIDLEILHPPDHVQIFKLWQIYLDDVNPLLKVTHTPTLQARLINATGNLKNIEPNLEALMFGVYCIAVMSLTETGCVDMFGCERELLMQRYRFGCQQALLKCRFLQSDNRDCLTALFLYLVAVRPDADPRSLSSLLGLTIRIAQRMGLDNESSNAKCGPLEGEMRRRLWWALLLFDNRVCEMGDYRAVTLSPSWNCKIPANLNDSDLQPEMKTLPQSHDRPTETSLAILRYKVADLVRHSPFFLDFTNPAMKALANPKDHGNTLETLQQTIEDEYLRHCNPENPYQFMTIWLTRGHIARYLLFQHFSIPPENQTPQQRSKAITHALTMLSCDTTVQTHPPTKKHSWFLYFHFPFPAYIHILQYLKREPLATHAEVCWRTMSQSCAVRFSDPEQNAHPFHKTPMFAVFTRIIVKAWEARVAALKERGETVREVPFIVTEFQKKMMGQSKGSGEVDAVRTEDLDLGFEDDGLVMPFPMMGVTGSYDCFDGQGGLDLGSGDNLMDVDLGALDLVGVDWPQLNISGS